MQYFSFLSLSLSLLLASQHVVAICPGFNYGVGNAQDQGKLGNSEVTRWNVYDDGCNVVDSLTTTTNPCESGTFSCTGSPITFNGYTNTFNGQHYACRPDANSGSCGGDVISICCRNDGN
ncbi:uncharacterized protein STEHIDRAFT_135748 [Stereum hirsutum FP-91666 SS1]|uniref:Uncharacterized protein n=1 Tax=Stereum hirsutum (strain FP-91666) TaxID=721885 RepID=R7RXC8_STEHR|nr:uncharacterized protein STEHIDRAFT_135748 [Stereum hirsutum FP-91666 SS1]EIM79478.1 hypothetical protein STEHIDRAFT_135748 [Stereum hirsutum FP-91666 SS1]